MIAKSPSFSNFSHLPQFAGANTAANDRGKVMAVTYMFEITSIDGPWPVTIPINLLDDGTAIAHARMVFRQLEDVHGQKNGSTEIVVRKEDRDLFRLSHLESWTASPVRA